MAFEIVIPPTLFLLLYIFLTLNPPTLIYSPYLLSQLGDPGMWHLAFLTL